MLTLCGTPEMDSNRVVSFKGYAFQTKWLNLLHPEEQSGFTDHYLPSRRSALLEKVPGSLLDGLDQEHGLALRLAEGPGSSERRRTSGPVCSGPPGTTTSPAAAAKGEHVAAPASDPRQSHRSPQGGAALAGQSTFFRDRVDLDTGHRKVKKVAKSTTSLNSQTMNP